MRAWEVTISVVLALALILSVVSSAQEPSKTQGPSMQALEEQIKQLRASLAELAQRPQPKPLTDKEQRKANAKAYRNVCAVRGVKFAGLEIEAASGAVKVLCK